MKPKIQHCRLCGEKLPSKSTSEICQSNPECRKAHNEVWHAQKKRNAQLVQRNKRHREKQRQLKEQRKEAERQHKERLENDPVYRAKHQQELKERARIRRKARLQNPRARKKRNEYEKEWRREARKDPAYREREQEQARRRKNN